MGDIKVLPLALQLRNLWTHQWDCLKGDFVVSTVDEYMGVAEYKKHDNLPLYHMQIDRLVNHIAEQWPVVMAQSPSWQPVRAYADLLDLVRQVTQTPIISTFDEKRRLAHEEASTGLTRLLDEVNPERKLDEFEAAASINGQVGDMPSFGDICPVCRSSKQVETELGIRRPDEARPSKYVCHNKSAHPDKNSIHF